MAGEWLEDSGMMVGGWGLDSMETWAKRGYRWN